MATRSNRYQRLFVLQPEYFEKLKKKSNTHEGDLTSLDKIMNKILNTKNLDSTSKWNLYKQALIRYTLKNKPNPTIKHEQVIKKPEKNVAKLKVEASTSPIKITKPEEIPQFNFLVV